MRELLPEYTEASCAIAPRRTAAAGAAHGATATA